MNLNDVFPSNYLKSDDLNGGTVTAIIREYKMEKLGDDNRLVLYFQNKQKGMVCNKTNASLIALVLGDNLNNWIGKSITIGTEMVTFQGKATLSLRVKNANNSAVAMREQAPVDAVAQPAYDDEIPF